MMKSVFLAAAAGALAATGSTAFAQDGDDSPQCVYLRNIEGYTVLDDQHVVLHGGASRHYLLTTRTRCSGLRFGVQLGMSFGETERLCRPFLEYIVPQDGWRCTIDTVEEVEDIESAREMVAARAINERIEAGEGEMEDPNR